MRTPKSHLTAEWTSVKKSGTYQKRYATSKGKEETTTRLEENHTHNIIKPNTPRCATNRLKNNYVTEVLPWEWEFWALWQAPQPGCLALGGEASRTFGFEGCRDLIAEAQLKIRGERYSILGRCTLRIKYIGINLCKRPVLWKLWHQWKNPKTT